MQKTLKAPKTWQNLDTHFIKVLNEPWYQHLTKLQDEFMFSTVEFYRSKKFLFTQLPLTTGTISSPMGLGSDSKPVKVNIEGIDTYLADSMQFFLEFACRINKTGAYYVAPSFRGELADERHLCQFYHSEAEIIGELPDVMSLCQDYLKHLVKHYLKTCSKEIELYAGTTKHLNDFLKIVDSIPKCTFDEAVKILNDKEGDIKHFDGYRTITKQGEKKLMAHFGGYVWLTHFDHLSVPFYQQFDKNDKTKAVNADLLMGIGETIGSGQRHRNGNEALKALNMHEVTVEPYQWYINLKNEVEVQTSGFGLGVERFFLWMLNHNDIRDMQLVPRFNGIKSVF